MKFFEDYKLYYCDIDDNLIMWDIDDYKKEDLITITDEHQSMTYGINRPLIDFLRKLKFQGVGVVAWSAAGGPWVKRVIEALEIEDIFLLGLSKPEGAIDDDKKADKIIKKIIYINPKTGKIE